ncbi:MAG: Sua5/YciO/YrdC/YwlC family protein [Planctomycetota bacterium]|nr:Sua5/YciO/YrdC/YwlC family protein [Planctomycetota bacterium]
MPIAERVPFADEKPARSIRKRVARILESGGLVALPTETVYGIAARADDPTAVAALRVLKGSGDEPLTWHVAEREAVDAFPHLRPLVRRLVERYWPGPLTLVLEGVPRELAGVAAEGWTGLRLSAHRGTTGLIRDLTFPVVLSSANRHGEEPLTEPDPVFEAFGEGLELVLDSGPSRVGESSAVLRVGRGRFELLRPGLLTLQELRRTAGLALGFCCTGNTCRSPMAAGLARSILAERLGLAPAETERMAEFGFAIASMGVSAAVGGTPAEHALAVMKEEGVDISGHRTSAAVAEEVVRLDRVYCLTEQHRESLTRDLSPGRDKNLFLLDPAGGSIADPIGGTRDDYRRCMKRIRACIEERATDWA